MAWQLKREPMTRALTSFSSHCHFGVDKQGLVWFWFLYCKDGETETQEKKSDVFRSPRLHGIEL